MFTSAHALRTASFSMVVALSRYSWLEDPFPAWTLSRDETSRLWTRRRSLRSLTTPLPIHVLHTWPRDVYSYCAWRVLCRRRGKWASSYPCTGVYSSMDKKVALSLFVWDRVLPYTTGWPWTHLPNARIRSLYHHAQILCFHYLKKILNKWFSTQSSSVLKTSSIKYLSLANYQASYCERLFKKGKRKPQSLWLQFTGDDLRSQDSLCVKTQGC